MIALLSHRIDTTSPQKATAMRDKVSELLAEDADVTVLSSNYAQEEVEPQPVTLSARVQERIDARLAGTGLTLEQLLAEDE